MTDLFYEAQVLLAYVTPKQEESERALKLLTRLNAFGVAEILGLKS